MKKSIFMILILCLISSISSSQAHFRFNKDQLESEIVYHQLEPKPQPIAPTTAYDSESPMIALTFDDGPSKYVTDEILDILEENGAKATFFVLGSNAEQYPDKLKRAVSLGCEIGNHTYNHPNLFKLDIEDIKYQVDTTKWCVYEACGVQPTLVRPPYGNHNSAIRAALPYPIIMWSVDTLDWENRDADKIIEIVLKKASDGDIILMHDLYKSTSKACKTIIPELIKRGYQLVTVSELLEAKGVTAVNGKSISNVR